MNILGIEVTAGVIGLGVVQGLVYGLLAVGLVLIYRANRIINLAHGEIGAVGAVLLGMLVIRYGIPYWLALPAALGASVLTSVIVEAGVVRRLRHVPKVMSLVATLGAGQVLLLVSLLITDQVRTGRVFPSPPGLPEFEFGGLLFTQAHSAMVLLGPLVVVALTYLLFRSRFGLAIRGVAANPEAARLAGVLPGRMSTLSWALAGALSALTAILIFPTRGFITAESLGPAMLLRALAAGVIARMTSLQLALVAGVGVGIAEQILFWNYPASGLVELGLFIGVVAALLLQMRRGPRYVESGESWAALQPWRPVPDHLRHYSPIRFAGWLMTTFLVLVAVVIPVVTTNRTAMVFVSIMAFALVGLSLVIVTGQLGQLSLGQFAFAGIGALVSYYVTINTGNFLLGFLLAGIAAALASTIIGLPALRIRGLMLAVVTLSFALTAHGWLLAQPWALGTSVTTGRPIVGSMALETAKQYYYFALAWLLLGLLLIHNIRSSRLGRTLTALRDNEDAARAFGIPATVRKLQAFGLAGVVAGVGGATFSHGIGRVGFDTFHPAFSIDIVAITVIGGISLLIGPLLGALYVVGIPAFVDLDVAGLAASKAGWLILILYLPAGLAQLIAPVHKRLVGWADSRVHQTGALTRPSVPPATSEIERSALRTPTASSGRAAALLEVRRLHKSFGGLTAVDHVSLDVQEHETLGIIGPNGAGKTTLFELISGFTRADGGSVSFAGRDLGRFSPERRSRLGLVRSFQDAALFETLTVLETVQLAHERHTPTRLLPAIVGLRRPDRAILARSREIVLFMGLDRYRDTPVRELSTGTRRMAELACVVALEPQLILLDEPSSGVAQRETEQLGDLIERVRAALGATVVIIEHDIPLITALSDQLVAMESGRIITVDEPTRVVNHPAVVESYLGGDPTTIRRSGAGMPAVGDTARCSAVTRAGHRCRRQATSNGYCHQHAPTAHTGGTR